MNVEKPELINFILKDVNSEILKKYIKDLEEKVQNLSDIINGLEEYLNQHIEEWQYSDYDEVQTIINRDKNLLKVIEKLKKEYGIKDDLGSDKE